MDRHPAMTPPTPRRGNFVLLRADALWLLLPQHEVGAVEYLQAPPVTSAEQPGVHTQPRADGPRQLIALSSGMTLLHAFPTDRMLVTALAGTAILWCWSELKVLIDASVQPRPIPGVLHGPGMPVHEFIEHAAGIAFVCGAQALCAHALGHETLTR